MKRNLISFRESVRYVLDESAQMKSIAQEARKGDLGYILVSGDEEDSGTKQSQSWWSSWQASGRYKCIA